MDHAFEEYFESMPAPMDESPGAKSLRRCIVTMSWYAGRQYEISLVAAEMKHYSYGKLNVAVSRAVDRECEEEFNGCPTCGGPDPFCANCYGGDMG